MPSEILFKQLSLGPMENFVYIIGDQATRQVLVVDPAWEADRIIAEVGALNATLAGIFITHSHPDHINAIDDILKVQEVPLYVSDFEFLGFMDSPNMVKLDRNESLKIGGLEFETLHTPGHTPGSICLKYKNVLITGDTLFIDGCGRCDLPGGDPKQMYDSLYHVISPLPDDTVIYPGHCYGHNDSATLGDQKRSNPYLTCTSEDIFLSRRMGLYF